MQAILAWNTRPAGNVFIVITYVLVMIAICRAIRNTAQKRDSGKKEGLELYNSIDELILEFLPFFILPVIMLLVNGILRIIKDIAQCSWIEERETEKAEEKTQKISIDKDLQKYFNYKE